MVATQSRKRSEALRREIELRAYYKYREGGNIAGRELNDWLAAEQEVHAERSRRAAARTRARSGAPSRG